MTESVIQQPQSTLHNAINAQRCNDRQSTDNPDGDESTCGGLDVTTQCSPARTGLFRDPLEVLGNIYLGTNLGGRGCQWSRVAPGRQILFIV